MTKSIFSKRFRYRPNYINSSMSPNALKVKEKIRAKINDGTYKLEACNCYCGSNESILISEMDRYGNYYPFVLCKKCGIMRASPRLTKESYVNLYTYDYRTLYGDNDWDKNELYKMKLQQAQEAHSFIAKYITLPPKAVVFDIGCNMGTMLLPFHQNGCEVMGVDYGIEYIEFGRKKTGLNLQVGGIEKLRDFGGKADLVILNHVLEHFLDLENELAAIRKIIKPDGYIFIDLPGTLWWIKKICKGNILSVLQNAHTWQFSLSALRYAMECCGFELIYGNEEIKSIFKLSNIFKEKTAVPHGEFDKVLAHLRAMEHIYLFKSYLFKPAEMFGIKEIMKNAMQRIKDTRYE